MEEKEQYKHIKQSLEKAALQPTENDWHDMEALLDTHLPTGAGGGAALPKAPRSFLTYTTAIIIAVITIVAVVLYTTQKSNEAKTAVNNTAARQTDNDSINNNAATAHNNAAEKNNGDNNNYTQQGNKDEADSLDNANGNTQQKNNTSTSTVPASVVNDDNANNITGKQQQSNTVNATHDGAASKNTITNNTIVTTQTPVQRTRINKSNDQQKKIVAAKDNTVVAGTQKGKAGLLPGNNTLNSGDTKSISILPGEAVTNNKEAQQKKVNTSVATILQQPNTMAYSNNLFDVKQSGALTGSLYKKETDTVNKFNYTWKGGSFIEDLQITNIAANKSADSIHQNMFAAEANLQTAASAKNKKENSKTSRSGIKSGGGIHDDKTFHWGLQLSPLQFNLVNGSSNQAATFNYIPGLFGQLHLNSKLTAGLEILPFARNGISNSTYFSNSSSIVSDSGSNTITTKTKSAYTASLLNTFKGGIHLNYKLSDNLSAEAVVGMQMPYSGKAIRVDSSFQFINTDSSFTGSSSTNIKLKKSDPSFSNINSSTFYAGFMFWYTQNKFSLGVGYQQNLQGWFKNTTPNPASKQFQITLRYYIK